MNSVVAKKVPTERKLKLTDARHAYKPMNYPWAYDAWLEHEQMHWLAREVSLGEDLREWQTSLTESERLFLTNVFRFFTQADVDVAGAYVNNYLPVFPQPEIRMMLSGFAAREAIHIDAYSYLIESLGMPESIYNEFLQYESMVNKHEFILGFQQNNPDTIAQQMAVFSAFTEGLQLFSSFVMLLNFPRFGKMKGMGQIVTWAMVDESAHVDGMMQLFRAFIQENRHLWNDELKKQLYDYARIMVDLEDQFIDMAFATGGIEGLSADEVKHYIRYICDRRLIGLGLKGEFKVKDNPLPWVEEIMNAPVHTNFFENRSTDYGRGALKGTWNDVWA